MRGSLLAGLFCVLVCVTIWGCSGPTSRPEEKTYPVRGTVMLDDKPMAEGEIYFKNPAAGSVHMATIKDGKFEGRASAGEKRVEIYAYKMEIDPMAKEMYGDQAQPTKINLIPDKYNANSTLKATVEASEAPDKNTFEFKVTSQ